MLELISKGFNGHVAVGISVIGVFFVLFLVHLIRTKALHHFAVSLLITTGILFTFYGISVGLMGFDVNDTKEGLPNLINGIKTAFLVSVVGVLGAIILKVLSLIFELFSKKEQKEPDDYTLADVAQNQSRILTALEKQIAQNENSINAQNEMNTRLIKAISGDEDSSLLTQVKNLRMDINDKFSALINEFKNFATTMAQNNQKALIEALSSVIKDFNDKLTEQFGENFKELNSAVAKLVLWQGNYKNYIENTQNSINSVFEALTKQSDDYKNLVNSTNEFLENSKEIYSVVENIKEQRELLAQNSSALAAHLDSLKFTIPEIMEQINSFAKMSNENFVQITQMSDKLSQNYETNAKNMMSATNDFAQSIQNSINEQGSKLNENFTSTNNAMIENIKTHLNALDSEFNAYNERLNTQLIEALNKASEGINSQAKVLDSELETALKNTSRNIAGISEQFVNDYRMMTENLRDATSALLGALGGRR